MTNHYFHLVKSSPSMIMTSRRHMRLPIIANSGAKFNMFKFLDTLQVVLGDNKKSLSSYPW